MPASRVYVYDAALAVWALCWIVLALLVAQDVRGLTDLSRSLVSASRALEESVDVFEQVEDLPFVGQLADIEDVRRAVARTARQTRASARTSRDHIERLSVLLAFTIAVVPTVPLLAVYLPLRRELRRRA